MKNVFRSVLAMSAVMAMTTVCHAQAFETVLTGAAEDPPNASPGIGTATIVFDLVANTLTINTEWSGLLGTTTVAHIHAPTVEPFAGTVGVAVTPGTLPEFPAGVTAGVYSRIIDLSNQASYTATFFTNSGGTVEAAEAALFNAVSQGRAYLNIHSSQFLGGEIRGFFVPSATAPEPGTLGLVALGICGAAFAVRRRK